MEDFVVMNNTFFRCGEDTWRYLWEQGMVFADEQYNFAVIGPGCCGKGDYMWLCTAAMASVA